MRKTTTTDLADVRAPENPDFEDQHARFGAEGKGASHSGDAEGDVEKRPLTT